VKNSLLIYYFLLGLFSVPVVSHAGVHSCVDFYRSKNGPTQVGPISMGSALRNSQNFLKATDAEVREAIERFDSISVRSPEQIKAAQKKIAERMAEDMAKLERLLTKAEVQELAKNFSRTGFFMSVLHEGFFRSALGSLTEAEFQKLKLIYSSEQSADKDTQARDAREIVKSIKDLFLNQGSFYHENSYSWQVKIDRGIQIEEKLRTYYSPKKLSLKLLKLEEFLKHPGAEALLELSVKHSLYDMLVVSHRHKTGTGTRTLTGAIKNIGGASALVGGAVIGGVLGVESSMFIPSIIGGGVLGHLSTPILFNSKLANLANGIESGTQRTVLAVKDATLKWRRWKQNMIAPKKIESEFIDQQNRQEGQLLDQNIEYPPLLLVKEELVSRITEPVQITTWSNKINVLFEQSMTQYLSLIQKQAEVETEINTLTSEREGIPAVSITSSARNLRVEVLRKKMTDLIADYTNLSSELLTLAHIVDLYKEKGNWELLNSPIPSSYKPFLEGKVQNLEILESSLNNISHLTAMGINRAYQFFLSEDALRLNAILEVNLRQNTDKK
jgi:hypothetical protein